MIELPSNTDTTGDDTVTPQVRKLTKINHALMQRVERSMDQSERFLAIPDGDRP